MLLIWDFYDFLVVFWPLFYVFSVISLLLQNRICPSYFHGFLANFVDFANIRLFFENCLFTESAHSAENFNISVTELGVSGTLLIFTN